MTHVKLFPCLLLAALSTATLRAETPLILDEAAVESLRIQTVEAAPAAFTETFFAIGRVESIPSRKSVLSSRIQGHVVDINAFEGDLVEKGQSLVTVESLQPGNPPPRIELHAPLPGMVMQSHTHLGKPVTPENELFEIVDLSEVYAVARLPEDEAGNFSIGTHARIKVAAMAGQDFDGKLVRYGSQANAASSTIDAYFILDNPQHALRPDMRVEFSIVRNAKQNSISVPKISVQNDGINEFVFVKDFDLPNAFLKVPVVTGSKNESQIEIVKGLFPGDLVVTQGAYSLMFAGGSSLSLKEALDAAHGHAHNEDGSEMTGEQKSQSSPESGDHDHGSSSGPLVWFLSILSTLLAILLTLSLVYRPNR